MTGKPTVPFGALLRHYRGSRGLTQEELAERSGLSTNAVSMLERGVRRAPHASTVEFLVRAMELDASQREALLAAAAAQAELGKPAAPDPGTSSTPLAVRDAPADDGQQPPPTGAVPAGLQPPGRVRGLRRAAPAVAAALALVVAALVLLRLGAGAEHRGVPGGRSPGAAAPAAGPVPGAATIQAPASLAATPGDRQVVLAWTPVPGATGYYIWMRDATLPDDWHQLAWAVSATTFTVMYLSSGHHYRFRIETLRWRDRGAFSPVADATLRGEPANPPGAPTGLAATAGDGLVTLTWNPVDGALSYLIYVQDVTAGSGWTQLPVAVPGTSFSAQFLHNGSTYRFKIQATNLGGSSAYSNTASAVPTAPAPHPST